MHEVVTPKNAYLIIAIEPLCTDTLSRTWNVYALLLQNIHDVFLSLTNLTPVTIVILHFPFWIYLSSLLVCTVDEVKDSCTNNQSPCDRSAGGCTNLCVAHCFGTGGCH